jgi:hypothetical protein
MFGVLIFFVCLVLMQFRSRGRSTVFVRCNYDIYIYRHDIEDEGFKK